KHFGDALRTSLTKMSDQPIDLINFIDSADRLFAELEVPIDIRVTLIKLYLNERALTLVNRLSGDLVIDYAYVNTYLLEQFRLCPQYFIENFNRLQRPASESYKSFCSRLTGLLQYYIKSRKVEDLEGVTNLLIADRIKTSLSESAVKHVLTIESASYEDWLNPNDLCNVLDIYYSNYNLDDRPRASSIGVTNTRYGQNDRREF